MWLKVFIIDWSIKTLSALDEMLALTNFDDIVNNDNINEATQLLFDRINDALRG